jgi:hypothetical protein
MDLVVRSFPPAYEASFEELATEIETIVGRLKSDRST